MRFGRWEVWWANVQFEDRPDEEKLRPVLIINDRETYVFSLKMTSHEERANDPLDYTLRQWQHAKLKKPTTVRVRCLYQIGYSSFVEKIGRLHVVDILEIQKIIERRKSEKP